MNTEIQEPTRREYERDLSVLRDDIVQLSSMVKKAIARSTDALVKQDVDAAEEIVRSDKEINGLRRKIEDDALTLIATQAPVAIDLRRIVAGLHILTDLERMGDHAAGNAKIAIMSASEPPIKPLVDIPRMSVIACEMLEDSISSFIDRDEELARTTIARDDEVDRLYDQVYRELLTYMMNDPQTIERATRLLWSAHNLERIADRTTNICEQAIFIITGRQEELDLSLY